LLVEPSDQWADSFPTCAGAKSTCMPTCPLASGPKYLLAPHPIDGPRETLASPIHWPPPLPSNPLPPPHDDAGGRRAGEWAHGRRGGGSGPRRGNGKRRRRLPVQGRRGPARVQARRRPRHGDGSRQQPPGRGTTRGGGGSRRGGGGSGCHHPPPLQLPAAVDLLSIADHGPWPRSASWVKVSLR
jgi:hypothetical protein